MQRRLFLQLLGIGGVATATLPLITRESSALTPYSAFQHSVIREGSYTGRIFDGSFWSKGVHVGFPSINPLKCFLPPGAKAYVVPSSFKKYGLSDLDKAPHVDMEGSLKAIESYNYLCDLDDEEDEAFRWLKNPRVGERIGQGLALFRCELRAEIEDLWERSGARPEEASLVTIVPDPLKCSFRPDFTTYDGEKREATLTISLHRRHYILEGQLKPGILWSDSGRIPLDDDFVGEDLQHFHNDQRRGNVLLVNNQNIPEGAPSFEDLSSPWQGSKPPGV